MKTIYFKTADKAEAYAKQSGQYFESGKTYTGSGEVWCLKLYTENLVCTHKIVIDEGEYEQAELIERGE